MTVGYQNYGYSNYNTTNYPTAKKSNKAAIAAGVTLTAGIALTAVAAAKGKKITGQEKLTANLKAGFSQIKDDVVKFAQTQFKKLKASASGTQSATQSVIQPNNVEKGISTIVNTTASGAAQAADNAAKGAAETAKEAAKEIKGIIKTYIDEAGNKISITQDGCTVREFANGFHLQNTAMGIDGNYYFSEQAKVIKDLVKNAQTKGSAFVTGLKDKLASFFKK